MAPDTVGDVLLYQVQVCSSEKCQNRSLVWNTWDNIFINQTTVREELHISVRTCDRCGGVSLESANGTVPMMLEDDGKSALSNRRVGRLYM